MGSFSTALGELARAQKSSKGVSLYSRFVNRPLGRLIAAACYSIGMSPNAVTIVSAIVTAVGLVVLATGAPTLARAIVVTVLLVLGFALDSADGQVSRLTGRSSRAGEWLDHVVDAGKMVAVHATVLIMLFRYVPVPAPVYLIPLAFQFVAVVTFAGGLLVDLITRADAGTTRPTAQPPSLLRSIVLLPADYGVLALSFVLVGWPPLFLAVYGLLLLACFVIMVLLLAKWFRQLQRPS